MDKYLEEISRDELPLIKYNNFEKAGFINHGFTTRLGGKSQGIYKTLNLSFTRGDDEKTVLENYKIIARNTGLDINKFVASDQTHTTNIRNVTEEDCGKGILRERDYKDIDGLITDVPGITLFTYYADCVPLFFADINKKVVAVSHSGWRGTVQKMGQVTVEKMIKDYGCSRENIICAIGPSICKNCYQVSEDVIDEFKKNFKEKEVELICELDKREEGKYLLDLWKANELILRNAGIPVENIENRRICTCCNKEILFSHRGLQGKRGNLGGFISIKP